MPLLDSTFPGSPSWQFNGHLQTIAPSLLRNIKDLRFVRERIQTDDDDFLDLDWCYSLRQPTNGRLAILSHGLEGSTRSTYIVGMAQHLTQNGWDVLAWNCRSCSGEMNRQFRMYHHGDTEDIGAVVQHALSQSRWSSLSLIGFSMGANMTMKYLGILGDDAPAAIRSAIVFSGPCDLEAGANVLDRPENWLYKQKFLRALSKKIRSKAAAFPGRLEVAKLDAVRHWRDFDEWFAAPICGYEGAEDFYRQASAKYFIPGIRRKTLLVSALNDPILTCECLPIEIARTHAYFPLELPTEGGHCGFMTPNDRVAWSERRALAFITE